MRNTFLLVGLIGVLLVGCAGFGIVATSDPDRKMRDADHLWSRQGRPLPAESLMSQAINIYKERGDLKSLGDAYRQYSNLLVSESMTKVGYRNMNFREQTVPGLTYENRKEKSLEYLRLALEAYQKLEPRFLEAKQYDALTNLYYLTAWTYNGLKEPDSTCKFFGKSLEAYAENIRLNPSVRPFAQQGFNSFPEEVAHYEKELHLDCNFESPKKD